MAQTGFTPILLYASSTPGNIPTAGNLTNSASGAEIALNYADGRLFYKNASNVITQLADRTWVGTVTSVGGTGSVNGITLTGTVTSSGNLTLGGTLGNIANSQLTNSTISGVALGGNLFNLTAGTGVSFSTGSTYNGSAAITINATGTGGTVTSVAALTIGTTGTDLSSTVANSTTTPVITLNVPTASATNRGALSAADWTTFNNKAPAFTYTTSYIPFGQGTTTPTQDSGLIYDNTNKRLGVGTSTPKSVITAAKASTSTTIGSSIAVIAVQNTQSSALGETAGIEFFNRSTTGSDKLAGVYGVYAGFNATGYAGDLVFATQAAGATNVTEDMRIFASGGVSIGNTTDPGATNLSVSGNVVIATSGKGIDFSATAGTGTSELFADYEEGTWTPVDNSGAGLTLTNEATATYTKTGRMVVASFWVKYPVTASGANAAIGGLPFTAASGVSGSVIINQTEYTTAITSAVQQGTAQMTFFTFGNTAITNTNLSNLRVRATAVYFV